MRKTLSLSILLIMGIMSVLPGRLIAQARLTAQVSKTQLVVGEKFQLEFSVNVQGSHFTPPDLSDFRILSGPNQSTSMQVINGRMTSSFSFSYILMAVKEGEFVIAPAAFKAGNDVLKSNEITITVTKSQQSSSGNSGGSSASGNNDENIYIQAAVSKSEVYQGEQITVTYKLYFRPQIIDYKLGKLPSLNGFWSQNIPMQQNQRTEYVNGVRYNVADLHQVVLFPQRTGQLTIDPFEASFVIRLQAQRRPQSLFDQFFGSYDDVTRDVKSKAVKIKVKELPSGAPSSYSGAVGKFNMNVEVSKQQVKANESVDLKITIDGTGNLKLLSDPKLKLPPDFEVYDPEIDDNISVKASGVSGKRTYKYLTIPRHKGNYTIEPIQFSYFDPSIRQYKTITSDPIEITVEKGDADSEAQTYNNISKEDIKILGNDIRYIKALPGDLREKGASFYGTTLFLLLLLAPFVIFIGLILLRNYNRKFQSDVHRVRSSKATKVAGKRLAVAKKHLTSGNNSQFYEEISKALYGYAADKLNMAYGDLSREKINEKFSGKGIEEPVIKEYLDIIDTSEMARFAPVGGNSSQEVYDRAAEAIRKIENQLK